MRHKCCTQERTGVWQGRTCATKMAGSLGPGGLGLRRRKKVDITADSFVTESISTSKNPFSLESIVKITFACGEWRRGLEDVFLNFHVLSQKIKALSSRYEMHNVP